MGKEYMGEADISVRDVVRRSLSSVGTWIYERAELTGVESGAVHIKFRFQPVVGVPSWIMLATSFD